MTSFRHIQTRGEAFWEEAPDDYHIEGLNEPARPINPEWIEWLKRYRPGCIVSHLFAVETIEGKLSSTAQHWKEKLWLHM